MQENWLPCVVIKKCPSSWAIVNLLRVCSLIDEAILIYPFVFSGLATKIPSKPSSSSCRISLIPTLNAIPSTSKGKTLFSRTPIKDFAHNIGSDDFVKVVSINFYASSRSFNASICFNSISFDFSLSPLKFRKNTKDSSFESITSLSESTR